MNKSLPLSCLAVLLASLAGMAPALADQSAIAAGHLPDQVGLHKQGYLSKADSVLVGLFAEFNAHVDKGGAMAFKPSNKFVQTSVGSVLVDVRAAGSGEALRDELVQVGMTNVSQYGNVVSGLLPFSAISNALALPNLRSISTARRPVQHAGSITSQGDAALRADIARSTFAVDGSGIGVGVISDSFDTLGGAASDIASGDLPVGGVTVLNGESIYCGLLVFCIDEGRAMLQIIHDVASGAELFFHTGIDGIASYANAISNLSAAGADVIVDDLLIINEPMFQDGIVAQAVDAAVASGVTYFSAAGNSGRKSLESAFTDSGEVFCIEFFEPIGDCDPQYERVGTMHDFDPGPGVDNYMSITIPEDSSVTIAMQWDQPFGGSGPTTDHDIVLLDGTGQTYIAISANDNIAMGEGWEALQYDNAEVLGNGSDFTVILTYDDVDSIGPPATLVKLVVFGEGTTLNEYSTNGSTLYGHANAAGAEAVGAAFFMDTPVNGTSPPVLEPYSAAGGTPILFDPAGTLLGSPVVRQKPEITAVDGVNTTFFFDDSYGSDGVDDFFGTSAAAPHAAGVAALLLEARPGATPLQVKTVLENTAIDMGVAGVDYDSGYGLIQADAAIAEMLAAFPVPFTDLIALPNVGGSAAPDVGVVIEGASVHVHVRDGSTDALLSDIDFGTDPAYGILVVPDLGDAGSDAEIALLGERPTGQIRVQVKDSATGGAVSNLFYGSQYSGVDMALVSDYGGGGLPELAVLGVNASNGIRVQTRDIATDTFLDNLFLGSQTTAKSVASVADVSGNGLPEIGMLSVVNASSQARLQVLDTDTGVFFTNVWFGNIYTPVELVTMPTINGGSAEEFVGLGINEVTGGIRVQIRDSGTAAILTNMFLGSANAPVDLAVVADNNGNGFPEIAVLMETPAGNGIVKVHDSNTGLFIRNVFFNGLIDPVGIVTLPNYAGGPGDEIAVLGTNGGVKRVQIKDSGTNAQINNVEFP